MIRRLTSPLDPFVADHFSIVMLLGLLAPVTDGLSTYVQEQLAIGRRGWGGEI